MDLLKHVMLASAPVLAISSMVLAADATQPASQPATNPATQPATTPASQPATQPLPEFVHGVRA